MFFIVTSFLFALYRTMKFRIHFCLIVTLFFYLIRSTEYVIILIVEHVCSISKATSLSIVWNTTPWKEVHSMYEYGFPYVVHVNAYWRYRLTSANIGVHYLLGSLYTFVLSQIKLSDNCFDFSLDDWWLNLLTKISFYSFYNILYSIIPCTRSTQNPTTIVLDICHNLHAWMFAVRIFCYI